MRLLEITEGWILRNRLLRRRNGSYFKHWLQFRSKSSISFRFLSLGLPKNLFLYDDECKTLQGKRVIVLKSTSYAAFRDIRRMARMPTVPGIVFWMEGTFTILGSIGSSWWTDSLVTAPNEWGISFLTSSKPRDCASYDSRRHVKVEPARWFTMQKPKLGLLVWQGHAKWDMEIGW